jgi:hypothetical protein
VSGRRHTVVSCLACKTMLGRMQLMWLLIFLSLVSCLGMSKWEKQTPLVPLQFRLLMRHHKYILGGRPWNEFWQYCQQYCWQYICKFLISEFSLYGWN